MPTPNIEKSLENFEQAAEVARKGIRDGAFSVSISGSESTNGDSFHISFITSINKQFP